MRFIKNHFWYDASYSSISDSDLQPSAPSIKKSLLWDFYVLIFSAVIISLDRGNIYDGQPEYVLMFKINGSENQKLSKCDVCLVPTEGLRTQHRPACVLVMCRGLENIFCVLLPQRI
jgi:hypothetical protein